MKYAIWRHENALGNSAEHTIGLAKHIKRINDTDPHIYVETEFQEAFARCIPGITKDRVHMFRPGIFTNRLTMDQIESTIRENITNDPEYKDIHFPEVYAYGLPSYKAMWEDLKGNPDITLRFPEEDYENKLNLPKNAIVMQIREAGTYWKRIDGAHCEPSRFVNPETFFRIALHFAEGGYKVVRIGDNQQTPMPHHKNIIDLARIENTTMMDDLFVVSNSKVFLSCDSGIWPIAGGMKKNLILSNVTSVFTNPAVPKYSIVDWLPEKTSTILYKENGKDNTWQQLNDALENYL